VAAAFRRVFSHHVSTWFSSLGWLIPGSKMLAHAIGAIFGVGEIKAIFKIVLVFSEDRISWYKSGMRRFLNVANWTQCSSLQGMLLQ
jgi:hypothetical protein